MSDAANPVVQQNAVAELTFHASGHPAPTSFSIDFTCVITSPTGRRAAVPGYWAGGQTWRVRYSSTEIGRHEYVTVCSPSDEFGLGGHRGVIEVTTADSDNPLLRHGPLRLSDDGLRFAHADGTPFFWLGDTWWFAAVGAFRWPDIFQLLTSDRVEKGFNVVQLVAGLFPEMEPLSERGANEGGLAWQPGFSEINPAYFDAFDTKIAYLVHSGLVPCIVSAWGYYLTLAGEEAMKHHWRYLVARYGAYPVVWCVAGEATMPYYGVEEPEERAAIAKNQREGWERISRFLGSIDPFGRLRTVHPWPGNSHSSGDVFGDASSYEFEMLQTGHLDRLSLEPTLRYITETIARNEKPALNGEPVYEGIMGSGWQDTQRLLFWSHILSGAAGHTYGNLSIAVFNSAEIQNPGITRCNDDTWDQSYDLPGSRQMGIGRRLLERFEWHRFKAQPELVDPHWTDQDRFLPYAAGIPGEVHLIYFPGHPFLVPNRNDDWPTTFARVELHGLKQGTTYDAHFYNPRTGEDLPSFEVRSETGDFLLDGGMGRNICPTREDWVLVVRLQ